MKLFVIVFSFSVSIFLFGCASTGQSIVPTATVPVPTPTLVTLASLRADLSSSDAITRIAAIAKLEQDGSRDAVAILGEFFTNADVTERFNAARALIRINTPQSQSYIRRAMSDKALTARRQVAMQALETYGELAYPFLQVLMRDADETVRVNTVQVIQFIGTAQARTLLQSALKDSSPAVQEAATNALQGLGFAPSPTP